MKNIFILYMAPGNIEQMIHYEDTIKKKVTQDRILKYLDRDMQARVKRVFGNKLIAVWGSRDSAANRSRFEKMQPGDDILIVEGQKIKLLGKVAVKTINSDLSNELWKSMTGKSDHSWDLIYFIANPLEIDLPFNEFKKLFGYKQTLSLRGFMSVAESKLKEFYDQYDDLYSILLKIKHKEKIQQKPIALQEQLFEYPKTEPKLVEVDEPTLAKELSEHVKIQWQLIRLGLKTGSKVWIPKSDQSKIQSEFGYTEFEEQFTSGIDTPAKFVDNIDVVWKEEFRIDAAFEIENTTAIYSGLLRFSDLKIVAPNSNYPLFIVAPQSKRNRVIEQMKRPTFKMLDFDQKVRYLPYETIEAIDKFFESSTEGLSVDLLVGKSEQIT